MQNLFTSGKKPLILLLLFIAFATVSAQSTIGITRKKDTSYTNHSAYTYSKKDFPQISIAAEIKSDSIEENRNITYCKQGDRKLLLDVFYPKDKKAGRTAFIMIHGGGWRSGDRSQHYALAQALAIKGYVCFTPEYRLSTEALFPAGVYDVKAAIRWVRVNAAKYGVDTGKIVIGGFSAGGELAAFMATTGNMPLFEGVGCNEGTSSAANALVDLDGTLSFLHPESREGNDTKSTSAGTYWFGYSKTDQPELWKAASPLNYVSAQTPPTLFINSALPYMHAGRTDYIKFLTEKGIYTEVHEFENSPHSFPLFNPWFTPTVNHIDAFLQKVFRAGK
jgi:acetyl esterase/lipase